MRLLLCLLCTLTCLSAAELRVGTTIGMLTDSIRAIGGDRVVVTGIIAPGVDPHLYQPTRSDVKTLMDSDLIVYLGLHLEGRMGDVLAKVGKRRPVLAVGEAVDAALLISEGEGQVDPHIWNDLALWTVVCQTIAGTLTEQDPDGAATYAANLAAFTLRLQQVRDYGERIVGSLPDTRRVLITAHDAFGYFGRSYGFEVLGVQGLSTESQAGLEAINRLVDVIVEREVPAIFVESSVSDRNIKALVEGAAARGHKVVIGGTLFSDAMGAAGTYTGTFIGMQDHNLTTVVRALGGEAPEGGMQGKLTP